MKKRITKQDFQRIVQFLQKLRIPSQVILLILGFASTVWFLFRVIPKPSRATYPCIKATAPWASAFVIYLLSLTASVFSLKKFRLHLKASRYPYAAIFFFATLVFSLVSLTNTSFQARSAVPEKIEPANQPMGIAKGIFPGRVVWVYNPDATNEDCTNSLGDGYFMDHNTDQDKVDQMLTSAIKELTGESTTNDAWDAIFRFHNQERGKGDIGYATDEVIFLKLNATSTWGGNITGDFQRVDNSFYAISETSPHLVLSVLRQLVNVVGVSEDNIYIGDPMKKIYQDNYTKWHDEFPNIHYLDHNSDAMGRERVVVSPTTTIQYSDRGAILDYSQDNLYTIFEDMEYMINIPTMKGHARAGVTMFAKNHFGSNTRSGASHLHPGLVKPEAASPLRNTYGLYRVQVDLLTHEILGKKNLVYLMDALFTSDYEVDQPDKWQMAPFNDDWTSSIFISQDPVAIESVGFDFLYAEMDGTNGLEDYPHFGAVDDYLHQTADSTTWPDGFVYDPENDAVPNTFSYGVHEHWNNSIDMQYTRNLGTGVGIEFVKIFAKGLQINPGNSGLLSEKVSVIHIDSFNVKWFGTDKGISRYDDSDWDTINSDNHLLNDNVKDLAYERTTYGHEIWVATDGGLSVVAYDIDGVTTATTYHKANSGIISDTIHAVGVDIRHNRWIGTPAGLSVYKGSDWDSTKVYMDDDRNEQDLSGITITSIASYEKDSMAFVTTHGGGLLRYSRTDLDGITGASSYEQEWSGLQSNTVNTVRIVDTIQWIGSAEGAYRHLGNETKQWWGFYSIDSLTISPNVTAIEVDNDGNIWFGTDAGLSIRTSEGWYKYTTVEGIIHPMVNDIKKDYDGNVWIATDGGVEYFSDIPGVLIVEPAPDQATNIIFSDISSSSAYITWTNGTGDNRVVFVKEGVSASVSPADGTTYSPDVVFGNGSELDGWYCIYNGSGNGASVIGLTPNRNYRVMVCEYYGDAGSEIYATSTSSGNPENFITDPVSIFTNNSDQFSIYPIPFDSYIHVDLATESYGFVATIYSLDGRLLLRSILKGIENEINTSDLPSGGYILQISDGTISISYKIVK